MYQKPKGTKDYYPEDKEVLLGFARGHRWIRNDFERSLKADEVPVIDRRGVV